VGLEKPIEHLSIDGFMSIRKLENLELGALNVLIGQNGAGKSNFVAFFGFLRELVEGRLGSWVSNQGGSNRILHFGTKETTEIHTRIAFGNNEYEFSLVPSKIDTLYFTKEALWYGDDKFPIYPGHTESKLKDQTGSDPLRRADYIYAAISSWRVYHFHDTSDSAGVKRKGALHDNVYLREDASNLAAYLHMLRHQYAETYSQIVKTVRLAIPFFDDFDLRPEPLRPDEYDIMLLWRQKDSDYPFTPSQLSDGSLRFICLVTALLQPNPPATIIIDEPELGLHPHAIVLLGALLRSASKRMQIIVATQSVPLVDEFSIDNLLIVERENGETVFCRPNADEYNLWLEEYSVGDLWAQNVLGGRMPA